MNIAKGNDLKEGREGRRIESRFRGWGGRGIMHLFAAVLRQTDVRNNLICNRGNHFKPTFKTDIQPEI